MTIPTKHHNEVLSTTPSLSPVALAPQGRRAVAVTATDFLQQVDAVEISGVEYSSQRRKYLYQIDVFLRHERNKIPSNQTRPQEHTLERPKDGREPDLRIQRSFSEFFALRSELLAYCNGCRHMPCDYCSRLHVSLLLNPTQPRMLTKLATGLRFKSMLAIRRGLLEKFLITIVTLVRATDCGESYPRRHSHSFGCEGTEQMPMMLHAFLQSKQPIE